MLAADRDIFFLPVKTHLEHHHPDRIELWIARAKPIVAMSIRDASLAIKRTFQSITGFFTQTQNCTLEDDPTALNLRPTPLNFLPVRHVQNNPVPRLPQLYTEKPPITAPSFTNVPTRSMPLCMAPPVQVDSSHGHKRKRNNSV
jgi:hypothetical protein